MVNSGRLRYSDLTVCNQFFRELQEHPKHTTIRDHFFLSGIARLTQSQLAIAPIWECPPDNQLPRLLHVIDSGWQAPAARTGAMNLFFNNEPLQELLASHIKQQPQQSFVLRRSDLYTDKQWCQLPYTLNASKTAHLDDLTISIKKMNRDWIAGLIVYRSLGPAARYTKRDAAILLLIQNLTHWLRCQDAAAVLNHNSSLPPRLSQVLNLLCQGCSEKQISTRLSLSRHTIHEHVKRLHRRFNVQTRSELLVKVLHQNQQPSSPSEQAPVSQA